ncbi:MULTISPECIES: glycerophosphodiester phosphodiesterase family protein [unclassified Enterococcus]|uniref:glycerophosphodiester phosphodiesterase family protein n=1 Tax=unclassified Enterococcus TaxID=2608891 RepID=UPI0024736FF6|nr:MULTISPECIES: glycerophosphodiester phosphodiesterase family protein [unclassified Enterococcus]
MFLLLASASGYWLYGKFTRVFVTTIYDREGYLFNKPELLKIEEDFLPLGTAISETQDGSFINSKYQETFANQLNLTTKIGQGTPVFRIIDLAKKQTTYQLQIDVGKAKHVNKVVFFVWGEADGQKDAKAYEATYNPENKLWESEMLVKDHLESGRYQVLATIERSTGLTETVEMGEFDVAAPTISGTIDISRVDKGQFDLLLTVNSAADAETVQVPIWSQPDQSDIKWYEAQKESANTYKVRMDYEDFNFANGIYTAEGHWQGENGLTAKFEAGQAEINLDQPTRVRLLQATKLFADRALTTPISDVAANSMAYIQGVVYNDDLKIYKTEQGYIPTETNSVNEMNEDIHFIAHRGNHQNAPENSLPSFYQATNWGVETDIQLTKDKQWVVMHDDTVDRMTNGKGKISDLTLDEIRQLQIDSGTNFGAYSKEQLRVPTIDEFLSIMQENGKVPFIELKAGAAISASDYDYLMAKINNYGFANTGVLISFDFNHLVEMKSRMPNLQVQLLSDTFDDQLIDKVSTLGNNVGIDVHYSDAISKIDVIARSQAKNVVINLWTTPTSEFQRVAALGINYLTTDYVD